MTRKVYINIPDLVKPSVFQYRPQVTHDSMQQDLDIVLYISHHLIEIQTL